MKGAILIGKARVPSDFPKQHDIFTGSRDWLRYVAAL
jgi:hypothetical protein